MVVDETTTTTVRHFEEDLGDQAATTSQKQKQEEQQQRDHSDEKPAQRKQPTGAAAASTVHLSTFLGSGGARDANVNNSQPKQQRQQQLHHHHHRKNSSAGRNKHLSNCLSQSQTRINHSLESINSKYSTSSANDDSSATTHSMHQQQLHQSRKLSPQYSNKLLSSSTQISGNGPGAAGGTSTCSPIEAQLASSTCDLGIKLTPDAGWRGSFSASTGASALSSVRSSAYANGGGGEDGAEKRQISVISQEIDRAAAEPTVVESAAGGPPKAPFMFAGVVASLVGSVFFSLSVLCIKLLPAQEGFGEKVKALCFRGFFVTCLCGITIIIQRSTIKVGRDELLVNILRAVFGTCGVLGLYSAISYISMGDATALIFSSPVWTSILSHFILGEPLQWLQLFALPASLFGIVLIAHPALIVDVGHAGSAPPDLMTVQNDTSALVAGAANGTNHHLITDHATTIIEQHPHSSSTTTSYDLEHRWPGIVIALATSLLVSCVYIALKFRKKTPIQTTTFWFGVFMILAALSLQLITGPIDIPWTVYEWSLLFGNGVTSWLGQSCLQWAFLYEEAGVLSIVRTLDVAMTFALSAIFLGEEILWTSVVGATIIGLVVVSIMLNEWIKKVSCLHGGNGTSDDAADPQQVMQSKKSLSTDNSVAKGGKQSAYMVASKA